MDSDMTVDTSRPKVVVNMKEVILLICSVVLIVCATSNSCTR